MLMCYLDDKGFARTDAPDGKEMLGSYFVQDIQGDVGDCNDLATIISEIEEGKRTKWEGTGNAHTLTIEESSVTIENEWDDTLAPCKVTLDEFKEALSDWREFIVRVKR